MQSFYDRLMGNILGTARDAGRYYRNTPNPGVLDFIEKRHSGALSRPGDPVIIPRDKIRPSLDIRHREVAAVPEGDITFDDVMARQQAARDEFGNQYRNPPPPPPVLENQSAPAANRGALANVQASSVNRRDQTPMSFKPQVIGDDEMLIRMGLAGLGANREGATASMGAMGDMYGAIQDANRSGLNSYNLAMQEAQAKAADAKAKTLQENQAKAGQLDQTIFDMDQALANLEGGMELTGWLDSTIGAAWDSMKGNPEAAARLLLKKLKVDDALLRVAQTKGAISNNEMKLFLSPAPADTEDEKVWIDWIKKRRDAAVAIRHRLLTGERVNPNEQATTDQVNEYGSGQSASPTYSAEDQALIDKYQ